MNKDIKEMIESIDKRMSNLWKIIEKLDERITLANERIDIVKELLK